MQMHTFTFPPEPLQISEEVSHQIELCYIPLKYLWAGAGDPPSLLYYLSAEPIYSAEGCPIGTFRKLQGDSSSLLIVLFTRQSALEIE